MGSGYSKWKKQARMFQEQMSEMQEKMQNLLVTGNVPNDLVQVTVNGEKQVKKIQIKKECVDPEDIDGLQDLILAACQDAYEKIEAQNPSAGLNPAQLLGGTIEK